MDSAGDAAFRDLFAAPGVTWKPIQPNYRRVRQLGSLGILLVFAVPTVAVTVFVQWWWLGILLAALGLGLTSLRMFLAYRYWKSWGYAELDEDLWITRGVMFRKLTAVPYGRMQVVEISSGPLERSFGMCTVKLVTASALTDAAIPGLDPKEATRLRDRLTELGDAKASGL